MKIPFYYSFKEFENNYKTDFEEWVKNFPDADEIDFLYELQTLYENFVRLDGRYFYSEPCIGISHIGESDYPEYNEISINRISDIVNRNIIIYCNDAGILQDEDPETYSFVDDLDPMDYWELSNSKRIYSKRGDNVLFEDHGLFVLLKEFFVYFINFYFDIKKYKNFTFSVVKIATYIDGKINEINPKKQPAKSVDIVEPQQMSTTEKEAPPKRLPAPVVMAMLKELGVFANFTKKGFGRNAIVDTLFQIIGTDKTNLGSYYDDFVKNGFKDLHIEKAKDFLNSKGL